MIGPIVLQRKTFPCQNCKMRRIGCHATCDAYKKAAAANQKANRTMTQSSVWVDREAKETTAKRLRKRNKGYIGRDKG